MGAPDDEAAAAQPSRETDAVDDHDTRQTSPRVVYVYIYSEGELFLDDREL